MKLKRITISLITLLLMINSIAGCGNNSKDTIIESTTAEVENYDKPLEIIKKYGFDISGEKFVERLDFITNDKLFYYVNNDEDKRITRLAYDSDGLKKYFTLESASSGIREIKVGDLPPNFKENDDFLNMLSTIIKACDPTIEESLIEKILDDTDIIHNHIKYKILANALFITPAYDSENKEIPRKQEATTQETTTIQETETATQEQTTQPTTVKETTTTEPTTVSSNIIIDWDKCIEETKAELTNPEFFDFVLDIDINVDESNKRINFSIVVNDDTDPNIALDFGDTALRWLNNYAKFQDSSLKSGAKNYYGGIYDKYDVIIGIAPLNKISDSSQWFVFDGIAKGIQGTVPLKLQEPYR